MGEGVKRRVGEGVGLLIEWWGIFRGVGDDGEEVRRMFIVYIST